VAIHLAAVTAAVAPGRRATKDLKGRSRLSAARLVELPVFRPRSEEQCAD
jgi:hypothetical protein